MGFCGTFLVDGYVQVLVHTLTMIKREGEGVELIYPLLSFVCVKNRAGRRRGGERGLQGRRGG